MKGSEPPKEAGAAGGRPEMQSEMHKYNHSADSKARLLASRPMAFVRAGTLGPSAQDTATTAKPLDTENLSMYDRLYMPQNERLQKKFQEIEKGSKDSKKLRSIDSEEAYANLETSEQIKAIMTQMMKEEEESIKKREAEALARAKRKELQSLKNMKQLKVLEQLKTNLARQMDNGGLRFGEEYLGLVIESEDGLDINKFKNWIAKNLKAAHG